MDNNNVYSNKLDEMVRPRSVYLTSELVPPDADASSAIYQLSETVHAQDGHDLVFGVRSFGFNASATNISRKQQNNSLQIVLKLQTPKYKPTSTDPVQFILDPSPDIETKIYNIIFPDGLYTTDELFSMLSNVKNYQIPSGYKYDVLNYSDIITDSVQGVWYYNDIFLTLHFESVDGGFKVSPEFDGTSIKNKYYTEDNTKCYSADSVNKKLASISIVRNPSEPGLYDLLFTNKHSDSKDHPGEVPQYETNLRGRNPPNEILFECKITLFDTGTTPDEPEVLDFVSVQNSLIVEKVIYYPDINIMTELSKKYPNQGFNTPNRAAVFYHTPLITPLYIDVLSDLETYNISMEGNLKGLLLRQFALGSENGGTSFFQYYDNPVFYKMSASRDVIDSIRISFRSEGGKWDFFNMEFFLELLVFEYPKEYLRRAINADYSNNAEQSRTELVKAYDDVTTAMGPLHNSFPFRHVGNDLSVAVFKDPERSRLKRGR